MVLCERKRYRVRTSSSFSRFCSTIFARSAVLSDDGNCSRARLWKIDDCDCAGVEVVVVVVVVVVGVVLVGLVGFLVGVVVVVVVVVGEVVGGIGTGLLVGVVGRVGVPLSDF